MGSGRACSCERLRGPRSTGEKTTQRRSCPPHLVLVLLQQPVSAQQRVAQPLHAVHALAARGGAGAGPRDQRADQHQGGLRRAHEGLPCGRKGCPKGHCLPCPLPLEVFWRPHLIRSFSPLCLYSRRKSSISWLRAKQEGRGAGAVPGIGFGRGQRRWTARRPQVRHAHGGRSVLRMCSSWRSSISGPLHLVAALA